MLMKEAVCHFCYKLDSKGVELVMVDGCVACIKRLEFVSCNSPGTEVLMVTTVLPEP